MTKIEGQLMQRNEKVLIIPMEQVLKEFGIDPKTHYVKGISGNNGAFHNPNTVMPAIEITLIEREAPRER